MSGPACLAGSAGPAEAPQASAGPRRTGFVAFSSALALVLALSATPAAAQSPGGVISVPDADAAPVAGQPYPARLTIAGGRIVEDVDLRISGLYHDLPAELDVLLVGPGGESAVILSDVGASGPVVDGDFMFDDEAPGPASDLILSGAYRPTDLLDLPPDVFPAPAPAGPYGSTLSVFDNSVADGIWSLYMVDDTALDGGDITGIRLSVNGRSPRSLSPNADPPSVIEAAATAATIRVVRRAAPAGAATVAYRADAATSDSPAEPGRDFEAVSGTLAFAPGETEKTISVPIADDGRFELAEQLSVTLAGPRGDAALTARTLATVTIRDDDPPSLRLKAKRVQRPLRAGGVTVTARASPGSRLRAVGTVALPRAGRAQLISARGQVVSGQPRRLLLRLRRQARRKLAAELEKSRRLTARVTVTATNDGRSAVARYRIKLRR